MEANRIILDMKYARIINLLTQKLGVSAEDAMDIFYNAPLFDLINQGVSDLHCRSDQYLADEIIHDYKASKASRRSSSASQASHALDL